MSTQCWRKSPSEWPEEIRNKQCDLPAHTGWTHEFTTEDGRDIYPWRDKPTATVIREEL